MTDENPWQIDQLDLPAYLKRVGLTQREPSLEALGELHTAHVRTFPFENLDVILKQHPGVELAEVQDKFVVRGRGGYCFEHSSLFAAVLERLGYEIERRLGRVGDANQAARTHLVVTVTIEGRRYLCDPGFGMSIVRPIPLEDGVKVDQDGWAYRLRRVDTPASGATWEMWRLREAGWEIMHTTDEVPVRPVDVRMGHHFTSTHPDSHFTRSLVTARHAEGRHTTVTAGAVTVRRPGQPTERHELDPAELPGLVRDLGADLTDDEMASVLKLLPTLDT